MAEPNDQSDKYFAGIQEQLSNKGLYFAIQTVEDSSRVKCFGY